MATRRLLGVVCWILVFLAVPTGAGAQTAVGGVARLVGEAKATNKSGVRRLALNAPILPGDAIQTTSGARLLVRFVDDSTLTLGENAHAIVDEMQFDSQKNAFKQTLDVIRGVFRYVSGRVAGRSREAVTIRTPVAAIGIRGTEFVAGELTVGMDPGRPHYGFQIRQGAIDVIAPGGSVALTRPGEGTFLPLTRIAAPTPVRLWTAQEAAEVDAALRF